uniref:Protein kinase domain-containing protein n=1 Tax=Branchiostoma floridae TaxID=7739 RepID=C3ZRK0_BRAFL|eukprot:XP_002588789.1 hypothetical protein BRAFLDRAFT_89781 [Branchiostoma floridae]
MDKNVTFFVLLTVYVLVVSDRVLVLGTLQLSTKVPENAHVGETVTSVRPATEEGREEVRCEIVAGDKNRRFRVTDCVIQVARPLDYGVNPSYNLMIRKGRLRTADADVTVAVKSVRIEDRRCYRAFCREVAALIAVHENSEEENGGHPNIVKLFGVVTMSTPKCILLEFAAKGELLLILKQPRQNRPLGRFVRYAVQISRALEELRRLRIAHGDVAARNVLVSGDDVAKLADFGLAHDVYTETTYVPAVNDDVDELLPLKWMALESLESREFTCESDTWSFGVLLWEIAAFGEEPSYQRQRQLSCPKLVGLLRQGVRLDRPPGCPDKLYDVMKSCWREEPSVRPEPAELERRLTECCQELDPLLAVDI